MKKKLWIFPVAGAMLLTLCLTGCDKTPIPTVPDDSTIESTNPTNTPTTENIPSINDGPVETINDVVVGTNPVWENTYHQLNAVDIIVDSNWSSHITIDGHQISSKSMTDMSVLDNYFYNESTMEVVDDMKMAYELDWRDFHVTAEGIAPNVLANGQLTIRASTYPSLTSVFGTYSRHLIINSIQYDSFAAEHDEIVAALKETHVAGDGVWGLGSTYDEVVAIMGKPTVEFSDDVYEHSILTTATYQTDDCVMTITFFTDTAAEKGFVVGLTWNPVVVNNTLSMQEGYDMFYSGLYSKLDFSNMTESADEDSNSHDSEDSVISE